MYRVMINGKKFEHDLKPGDRVSVDYRTEDTGSVKKITDGGLFVWVDWDAHCKDRLGDCWMPDGLTLMNIR